MTRPFRPGEPVSAKKLNLHSAAQAQFEVGSGSMSRMGASVGSADPDMSYRGFWVRIIPNSEKKVTDTTGGGQRDVYTYGWECIQLADVTDTGKGRYWVRDPGRFGSSDVDPVFASDFGKLTASEDGAFNYDQGSSRPAITAYLVVRDPASQRLVVVSGGETGGKLDVKGKDILLMPLGTYLEYRDCLPASFPEPPVGPDNLFCENHYAWAAYKICGYKFKKLFDMRTFGRWATELNGGTTSAWRRMLPAFWGWDDYTDGQPTGDKNCAGVRFINTGVGQLNCDTCPLWMDSTIKCLKIKFKTAPRPCPPPGYCDYVCVGEMNIMDTMEAWDKEFELLLCRAGCGFSYSGGNDSGVPFNITIIYEEIPRGHPDCVWGPAEFDPCDPCAGFGRWKFCIEFIAPASPIEGCDCGALKLIPNEQMKDLIVNCVETPVPIESCNKCIGPGPNYQNFAFVLPDSVFLNCCSQAEKETCGG